MTSKIKSLTSLKESRGMFSTKLSVVVLFRDPTEVRNPPKEPDLIQLVASCWRAVVPPARTSVDPSSGSRVRYQPPTRWKPWSAKDYTRTNTPRVKVHKGHGPAGLPAPVHPPSPRELVLFTDGGCVENALVGEGEQLAGSGCVVLNGSRDDATAAAVRL